jgi:hypothetical protein
MITEQSTGEKHDSKGTNRVGQHKEILGNQNESS